MGGNMTSMSPSLRGILAILDCLSPCFFFFGRHFCSLVTWCRTTTWLMMLGSSLFWFEHLLCLLLLLRHSCAYRVVVVAGLESHRRQAGTGTLSDSMVKSVAALTAVLSAVEVALSTAAPTLRTWSSGGTAAEMSYLW